MKVRVRICSCLYEVLSERTLKGTLHSCFHRAMNMAYENGLVTFLAKEKSLQPFSLTLDWSGDFLFVKELVRSRGTEMRLNLQELWIGTYQVFEFETFEILNLKKRQSEILNPAAANSIRSFLSHQEEKGIHGLKEEQRMCFLLFLHRGSKPFETQCRMENGKQRCMRHGSWLEEGRA